MSMKDFSSLNLLITGAAPYYSDDYPLKPYDVALVRGPIGMTGTASVTAGPIIVDSSGLPTTDLPITLDDSGYAKFSIKYDVGSLAKHSDVPTSVLTIYPDVKWSSLGPVVRPTQFRNWMQDQADTAPNIRAYGYTSGASSQTEDPLMLMPCSVYVKVNKAMQFKRIHVNVTDRNEAKTTTFINTPGLQDTDIPLKGNEWASFNLFNTSGNDINSLVTVTIPDSSDGDYLTIYIRFYADASWPNS